MLSQRVLSSAKTCHILSRLIQYTVLPARCNDNGHCPY